MSWLPAALLVTTACADDETAAMASATVAVGSGGNGGRAEASSATVGTAGGSTTAASTAGSGGSGASSTTGAGGSGGVGGAGGSGGRGPTIPSLANCEPAEGTLPPLKLTPVALNLGAPVLAKSAGTDTRRLYIVDQVGTIWLVKDGTLLPDRFLDISNLLLFNGERGLLGLAFHPQYAENGRFFVHYSAKDTGATTVAEFARSANPDLADPTPVNVVITVDQPEVNHNGGTLEFGADGMLYLGLGDGGSGGDPWGEFGNGQNTQVLLGKMLRLDVATTPYSIPNGNMTGVGVAPEIWDYGLRNPWRSSFDVCTGDLYIGDVGQNAWEEIDIEPAGRGGRNYGWRLMEGNHCFLPSADCDPNGTTTLPVTEYPHEGDDCSVIGGYVYRGSSIPALRGTYIYGDLCSARVRTLVWHNGAVRSEGELTQDLETSGMLISSFGQDALGEVYLIDIYGDVYRIDPE